MSKNDEIQSNVFDIKEKELNQKDHNFGDEEIYPESTEDMTCWEKFKNALNNFANRTIDYFQYDRVFNGEGQPTIDLKKCYKRFLENYDETYSERQMRFALSFDYVLEEKLKEQKKKEKNFCTEFYRFICCQGGNEMEEIDESYKSEREYQRIIKKKLLQKKEQFQEMMKNQQQQKKKQQEQKQKQFQRQKENAQNREKLQEIINNDSLQFHEDGPDKNQEEIKKKPPVVATNLNTKLLKVNQTEHNIDTLVIDEQSNRTHKKGPNQEKPSNNKNSNIFYNQHEIDQEEIANTLNNKYAKAFNASSEPQIITKKTSDKVLTNSSTQQNIITKNIYHENHVYTTITHERQQEEVKKKRRNKIEDGFDDFEENDGMQLRRKKKTTRNNNFEDEEEVQDNKKNQKVNLNYDSLKQTQPAYNSNSNKKASSPQGNDYAQDPNIRNQSNRNANSGLSNSSNVEKGQRQTNRNNANQQYLFEQNDPQDRVNKGQRSQQNNISTNNGASNKSSYNTIRYNNTNSYNDSEPPTYANNIKHSNKNNSIPVNSNIYENNYNTNNSQQPKSNQMAVDSPNHLQAATKKRSPSYDIDYEARGPSQSININEDPASTKKQKGPSKKGSNFNQQQQIAEYNYSNKDPRNQTLPKSPKINNDNSQLFFEQEEEAINEIESSVQAKKSKKKSHKPQKMEEEDNGFDMINELANDYGNHFTQPGQGVQEDNGEVQRSKKQKRVKNAHREQEENALEINLDDGIYNQAEVEMEAPAEQARKKKKVKKMMQNPDHVEEEITFDDFGAYDNTSYVDHDPVSNTVGVSEEAESVLQASKKRRNKKQLRAREDDLNVEEVVFDPIEVVEPITEEASYAKAEKKKRRVKQRKEEDNQDEEVIEINF